MAGKRQGGTPTQRWTMQHRPVSGERRADSSYFEVSKRPLQVLVFLIPFLFLYESGTQFYLSHAATGTVDTIRAHSILLGFFQDFGAFGRFLPCVALVAVLLIWHILNGDRWSVNPFVIPAMLMESIALTLPLLVLVILIQMMGGGPPAPAFAPQGLPDLSPRGLITISIGAGLYEELLFRMVGIAFLHVIFVDLAKMSEKWGTGLAILLSAAAFAVYHDVTTPSGELEVAKAISLLVAGAYFGIVYVQRGFGIVVAVHALYDIIVLVLLRR